MVEDPVSRGREHTRVPRNDLSQLVHPSPRSAEERAAGGHLRSKRRIRRSQHARIFKDSRGQIVDAVSIRQRPAEIEDRAIACHWEGDLIDGTKKQSHRDVDGTAFAFYCPGQGAKQRHGCGRRRTEPANSQAPHIPAAIIDLGSRARDGQTQNLHGGYEREVYFCDPHSPWQRGTNENTNRLLRQYLPKRTDLSDYTQSQLDKIALRLNQRPRRTLGFQTPASKLRASAAATL
jgi:IS30 family transposase